MLRFLAECPKSKVSLSVFISSLYLLPKEYKLFRGKKYHFFSVTGGSSMIRSDPSGIFSMTIILPFLLGQSTNALHFKIQSIHGWWLDYLFSFPAHIFSLWDNKKVGLCILMGPNGPWHSKIQKSNRYLQWPVVEMNSQWSNKLKKIKIAVIINSI